MVAKDILTLYKEASSGVFTGKPRTIGYLTAEGREFLERISGLRLREDTRFVVNPSDLNHIRHDHYGDNEKDPGNNVPLTDADIAAMTRILAHPDKVLYFQEKDGSRRKMFYFLASTPGGTYNLLEVYANTWGNLSSKTLYKTRKGLSQRVVTLEVLLSTSETYSGNGLSDANVSNFFNPAK